MFIWFRNYVELKRSEVYIGGGSSGKIEASFGCISLRLIMLLVRLNVFAFDVVVMRRSPALLP